MTRRSRPLLAAAIALTTALLATSCSSSGSEDDDASADASVPASPVATAPQTPAPGTPTDTPSDTPSGTASASPSGTPSTAAPGTPSGTATAGGTATTPPGRTTAPPAPAGTVWQPKPGVTWQWQLDGKVDESVDAPVYDIDGFENDASVVASLHAKGRKVICYINAGSSEDFRPDAGAVPKALQGQDNGWRGEKWLDIRQLDKLRPVMAARFDMCKAKGFDGVEPDTTDAYINDTGFPLTGDDQLKYNRMLAALAHERGLAVALKNDLDQIPALVGDFDFAVNEECAQFNECDKLSPFIKAGKAVLHVEYKVGTEKFCAQAKSLGLSSMQKRLELDAWRKPC
ncbi:endo alpha-1,4 polygalactosaminidase [Kitasatospora sp. NPDC050543]|uniref:endo alpha-1,4 polygalactosaminidase n=1 Tax=Kitasatospora sp. NPDC050543 TaxID=3364054 RepID=UPI0037A561FA